MEVHPLKPRNGVTDAIAKFDIITLAMEDLRHAYLDENYEELDSIGAETKRIRGEALEASKAEWGDIDMAVALAALLSEIEGADDAEAIEAVEGGDDVEAVEAANPVSGIATLRESDAYKTAHEKAQPLANVMVNQGVRYRLAVLGKRQARMFTEQGVWGVACLVDLAGDLSRYFDREGAEWPRLNGNAAANVAAVRYRVDLLKQLDRQDMIKLTELSGAHLEGKGGLTEKEEKN